MNHNVIITNKPSVFAEIKSCDNTFLEVLKVFEQRLWQTTQVGEELHILPRTIDGVFIPDEDTFEAMTPHWNELLFGHPRFIVLPVSIDLTENQSLCIFKDLFKANEGYSIWMRDQEELEAEIKYLKFLNKII